MTASSPLSSDLAAAVDAGALVLTASPRAARALQLNYAKHCQAKGLSGWRAPAIYEWSAWAAMLYNQIADMGEGAGELPLLLTPLQEEQLWQQVQATEADLVVSPDSLARLAQQAYSLLAEYDAHSSRRAPWAAAHPDAEQFLAWADAFEQRCNALQVVSPSLLNLSIASLLGHSPVSIPRIIWLVGFDRHTPSQSRMLQRLQANGTSIQSYPAEACSPEARDILFAPTPQQELAACAIWVRQRLAANPAARIGVLVPQLAQARPHIDRTFRRILTPQTAQRAADQASPYEFSLGSPLASIPVVYAALLLLRFTAGPLPAAEVSLLLTSGFLAAHPAEALALAESDAALRKLGLLTTSLDLPTLLRHCALRPNLLPVAVTARLQAVQAHLLAPAQSRSHASWSLHAPLLLKAFGWPGHQALSSLPFQARQRWDTLLEQLAQLDLVCGFVSWSGFVQRLSVATHHSLFAAEALDAPVQILGAAEAAGLSFDAIWFLSVQEGGWPQPGRLHPLLAPALQQDAGMPHSSPEGDRQLALLQMERIAASAPVVVCSYTLQVDNAEGRPSPLLDAFSSRPHQACIPADLPTPVYSARCEAEPVRIRAWPSDLPAGGSEVLKRQAACGFQAFALKRLAANPVEEESWGLDQSDRATILHSALEHLWNPDNAPPFRLHSLEDLQHTIGSGEVDDLVDRAVTRALAPTNQTIEAEQDPWRAAYLRSEHQRLCTLLRQWLDIEQERAPFTVRHVEQRLANVRVGPLQLNLRADRVDSVGGAHQDDDAPVLIVDYKTAADVRPSQWLGDRPDEPQLPIYALYGGIPNVAGIAFAQIRPGCFSLQGLAVSPATQLSAKHANAKYELTPATLAAWDQSLQTLALQFSMGDAPVNPKNGDQTCAYCGLQSVCRIQADSLEVDTDLEADPGSMAHRSAPLDKPHG